MALTDTKLRTLRPKPKAYSKSDGGGLFLEVTPSGKRTWGLRYRLGGKQEKAKLGEYPAYTLSEARAWRHDCLMLVRRGCSPMALKQGKSVPAEARPEVKELAQVFLNNWCWQTVERLRETSTMAWLIQRWYTEVVETTRANPLTIRRILDKDLLPSLGGKLITDVTVTDCLTIIDRIKARGSDQMALQTRNVLKRLFAYAIAREKATFNPATALEARYIATAKARDRTLTPSEIGQLLRALYTSSMNRSHKLALHLLILLMVRKSELIEARWEELDLAKGEWVIPGHRMKKARPHIVPLPRQAVVLFEKLKGLSSHSEWVFPSRHSLDQPIAHSTLNAAIRGLNHTLPSFVIHDFRRTASTHLHEAGFASDWIEKALAHETRGIRGVYNKAQYLDQRREMLQWWADFVDSPIEEGRTVILGRFRRA